ncbi:sigma 54-interacting transcriptional regulator [Terracidiphilus gabretensis]|uniref:sigma 54-interacting transcriptional regulator n=1 Tax=Terracidiphilus gabretensis TaxID=1577687 RepID=UPI00071C1139|nr:sigma 54-interacting transcriptional regulator [Terracidiphilus gabretensis]
MSTPSCKTDVSESIQVLAERLLACLPDAILLADGGGRICEANPQAEQIFGYTRSELLGQPVEMLIPERFHVAHVGHRAGYHSAPRMRPMGAGLELQGRRKNGSEFPVDILLSSVETAQGTLALAVVRDITERKKMEDALRASEERFRLLVDGARDYAIFALDIAGCVASWNPGAERIKGYCAAEIIGRNFSDFYIQTDRERGKPEEALAIAGREGRYEDEGWRVRKDGSLFWANAIITALYGKDGKPIGFSKVTRDFSNRKAAEEALLLELSRAMLSGLDIRMTLAAIAAGIQNVAPHDFAVITLLDSETEELRAQGLPPNENAIFSSETLVPMEGTPTGWTFLHQRPVFLKNLETDRFFSADLQRYVRAGVRSGYWLPLTNKERTVGTLFIGSKSESAFDPIDANMLMQMARQIAAAVDNVRAFRQISEMTTKLAEEKRYLEEELRTEYGFEEIVGESAGLKRLLKQAETVAPTDATVLILGETGTGKELIARAIHQLSQRRDRTFVKLNCSAIPLGLLESELFGHEKGAFTGAITQRVGRLELAHKGTLFLDEIGDLPLELQPKILRALQEKEIERLGGTRTISVDVRLVAATNRNLEKMIQEGTFRSDLYYRLNVFPIRIPPLRQRTGDIPLLVNYFLAKHARRMNKNITMIPPEAMAALTRWRWPGNIRELENFIERAVILTQGSSLRVPLSELTLPDVPDQSEDESLEMAEREHILRVLRECHGVIGGRGGAAEKLDIKRTTLNSKLKKLGIERKDYH